MQVHQVVDDTRLKVVLETVDDDLSTNVNELAVGEVLFVLVNGLVDGLVVANALAEVLSCDLGVLSDVIR